MAIRPVDIARKLGISTTTLRKYEELELTLPVLRSAAGYRIYTEEHIAYFICIREMLPGFTLKQIEEIFKEVKSKKIDAALWMANKVQVKLHEEKTISEKIVLNLLYKSNLDENKKQEPMAINDVSRETGVLVTTIRYWDKVGLISAQRCTENNYRMFTAEHVRQTLTIYALKFSVYAHRQKHSIEGIREELKGFNYDDRNRIAKMTNDIEQYLNQINRSQITGICALYHLCRQVETNHFDNQL